MFVLYSRCMKRLTHFILLTFLVFFLPTLVQAHGSGGTYEEIIDGYQIDIGYTPEVVETTSSIRFDFQAYVAENPQATSSEFHDVWVRIEKEGKLFFAGDVHKPVFGPTGFSTILTEAGEYTVYARFQNSGDSLVEAEFPLTVTENTAEKSVNDKLSLLLMGLAGLMVGFVVGWFMTRQS